MSDAYIKKYELNGPAERRKPVPDEYRHHGKSRKSRPFVLEYKWHCPWRDESPQWRTHKRYHTEIARDQALTGLLRKEELFLNRFPNRRSYMEYRIKPNDEEK